MRQSWDLDRCVSKQQQPSHLLKAWKLENTAHTAVTLSIEGVTVRPAHKGKSFKEQVFVTVST